MNTVLNDRVARRMADDISRELSIVGLFFRVFARGKSVASIQSKIGSKGYSRSANKLLQDLIGVRITLYFADDVGLVMRILERMYKLKGQTIDAPDSDTFKPTRLNMVFELPAAQAEDIDIDESLPIDSTFEVQIRTVLSEGWHEVEHDLRYKCLEDWKEEDALSRTLNGVMATLENCDWTISTLIDALAYRHYKRKNWLSMLRAKFRIRMAKEPLQPTIESRIEGDVVFAKAIFRCDRNMVLERLYNSKAALPLTPSNLVWFMNWVEIRDSALLVATPRILADDFATREVVIQGRGPA